MPRDPHEPVRLNRIYTGGGDRGETSLGDGSRTDKLDPRIAAYGAVDELNSVIGLVLATELSEPVRAALERVQNELFDLGADLSVPWPTGGGRVRLRIEQPLIDRLERDCDAFNEALPELKSFVLPGGSEVAARLHLARTIARRAELCALEADRAAEVDRINPLTLVYLNRLSDLLFILARTVNEELGVAQPLWRPGGSE